MSSCLMIYAALEHQIRKQFKVQNRYLPYMKQKPYQNLTARWMRKCFQGIFFMNIEEEELVAN